MSVFSTKERISILSDLVAINTVNGNESTVAKYLSNLLEKQGIPTHILSITDTRANLVAEIGGGAPIIAVSGHMDTVDPGDLNQWHTDPFKMTEIDGKLYGRGTDDMKSGLAALVIAFIELHHSGKKIPGTFRLLATIGEEVGELGSKTFYEQGYMKDAQALIIAEPSGYNIVHAQKGSMDLKISATGITVHSSMPEQGYNAINALITVLHTANQTFHSDSNPTSPLFGPMSFNIDTITGGSQINSIPDEANSQINVRTIPEFTGNMVLDKLNAIINNFNKIHATDDIQEPVKLDVYMNEPPVESPSDNKLIQTALQIGEAFSHNKIPVTPIAGITDASNLLRDKPKDFPFIVFGPGETNQAHVINEYMSKDMYLNFIEIYIQLFSHSLVD